MSPSDSDRPAVDARSLSEFCFDLIAATLPRPADANTPSNVVPFPSNARTSGTREVEPNAH